MEEPLLVFVSSVISGMEAERAAVRAAIQAIRLTRPWLFELGDASSLPIPESYLRVVRKCDIFVLLLGDRLSDPVKLEVETARGAKKPVLAFLKQGAPEEVAEYARSAGATYARFETPDDLAQKAADAVCKEIIRGWNDRYSIPSTDLGVVGEFLQRLAGGEFHLDTRGGSVFFGSIQVEQGGEFVVNKTVINADTVVIAERFAKDLARRARSVQDLGPATKAHLDFILDRHRYLNMKGMGVSDRVPLKLPLLDLYVPLKARPELPEGETWRRDARIAGRPLNADTPEAADMRLGEPAPVLDLLSKHDGLVILGDPGAGKTTFLKFLALRLALGEGKSLGLGDRLPILAPLSGYATALAERDVRLDDFIAGYFHDIGADLPVAEMLEAALKSGSALVLLDGLDEVKEPGLRQTVVERVTDFFTFRRKAGNKFVLTSRIVGYRDVRPTAAGLAECTLVDFDDEEIAAFVDRWTATLERQAQGDTATAAADARRERRELLDAIGRNPGVRRLAANPLLLTILALMKRQGVTLPERRVELYDQYVRTLLSTWNRARGLGRPPSRDLDVLQTVRTLAPLALWMHEVSPGAGLVKREDLRRRLEAIYAERGEADPERAAAQFMEDVHEHAGLLLERGPGEYGFIHLTFEEYLAAVGVAQRGQGDCRPIVDYLAGHVGDPAWREVALLTVGHVGIIQQLDRVAGEAAEALVKERPDLPGEAAVLAGEAVLDAWPGGVPPTSKENVVAALVQTMQDAAVPAPLRRRAGLALGRLGWRPADLDAFVEAPAGRFLYGDGKKARVIPHRYWIAKHPVTNAQYARFMQDDGYVRRELWSGEGWAWKESQKWTQPGSWEDAEWSNPIFPVVSVSWYEAEAYTNWLNTPAGRAYLSPDFPSGYAARLPSEEEWERAARGADGREYPWGDRFDPARANTSEAEPRAGATTAVCTYPLGESPAGAWDMSGNVWEWCRTKWREDDSTPADDRPEVDAARVLRGGAFLNDAGLVRCACRYWNGPNSRDGDGGFRVVASPIIHDSGD